MAAPFDIRKQNLPIRVTCLSRVGSCSEGAGRRRWLWLRRAMPLQSSAGAPPQLQSHAHRWLSQSQRCGMLPPGRGRRPGLAVRRALMPLLRRLPVQLPLCPQLRLTQRSCCGLLSGAARSMRSAHSSCSERQTLCVTLHRLRGGHRREVLKTSRHRCRGRVHLGDLPARRKGGCQAACAPSARAGFAAGRIGSPASIDRAPGARSKILARKRRA